MRRQRACRPLAVHEQGALLPVQEVLLDLGDVVRHVVDEVHVEVVGRRVELTCERLQDNASDGDSCCCCCCCCCCSYCCCCCCCCCCACVLLLLFLLLLLLLLGFIDPVIVQQHTRQTQAENVISPLSNQIHKFLIAPPKITSFFAVVGISHQPALKHTSTQPHPPLQFRTPATPTASCCSLIP